MNLEKLKLKKFKNITVLNFPKQFDLGIKSTKKNVEAVIYYIDELADVTKFIAACEATRLPKENRTIMVYQKGRNDGVNRDSIFLPFRDNKGFKLKAPMLCSLSEELSACVMCKIV